MSAEPLKYGSKSKMHDDANPPTGFTHDEWVKLRDAIFFGCKGKGGVKHKNAHDVALSMNKIQEDYHRSCEIVMLNGRKCAEFFVKGFLLTVQERKGFANLSDNIKTVKGRITSDLHSRLHQLREKGNLPAHQNKFNPADKPVVAYNVYLIAKWIAKDLKLLPSSEQLMQKKTLSVKQVCDLLHKWGFAEYKASFEDNLIGGDILLSMDLETLEDLEVKLNHRRCLLSKIKRWSKKVIKPEVITIGDVVCLESDAKQSNCGLVLSNGHCVFEDKSVHLTKTLSLVKKKFDKKLDAGAVSDIIRKIGKPEEAKMFADAKIGGEELPEVDAEWLGDIGITRKLRKRNLPISIKTELERMNLNVRKARSDTVKKLKAIWDELEAKRMEAERQRLEAERQRLEAERKRLEAERQRLEAEREAERQRLKAEREAERKRKEAERKRLKAEREAERKRKEAERKRLKAEREAERKRKEAERRKKEEAERRKKEEAERRKKEAERQRKLLEMKMWTKIPDMNTTRNGLGVAVGDGKLFAVGGWGDKSGEYLDLKNVDAGWKKIPEMNTERSYLDVAVGDGKLFAVGGYDGRNTHKSGEYLDLKNVGAGWTKLPDMDTARNGLGVAVGDGKLFAVGGRDGRNRLQSGEYLDLKNMDAGWKEIPEMNTGRSDLGVAVGDGKLFAVGGYDGRNTHKSGEYLDLKNVNAGWTKLPEMDTERSGLGVAVGDGKLFAVGGSADDINPLKSGEYLDLENVDAGWTKIPDMNTKRYGLGVAVGDGKLFAVGGVGEKSGEYLRIAM
eukprot:jgi/Bigna1/140702/aug1.57_g15410